LKPTGIEIVSARSITPAVMSADGLYRLEDDLVDGSLDAWIETVIEEVEAYLAAVTGSEPASDEQTAA
jgi:hypothetical protein